MFSNVLGAFGFSLLVFFTCIDCISGSTIQYTEYNLFRGRKFSSNTELMTVSANKFRCLFALRAYTHDFLNTIAVYNENTKLCEKSLAMNETLFLLEVEDLDVVALWNENGKLV